MGCLLFCFVYKRPKISVEYCIPSNAKFLIPRGKIIVGLDRKCNVPMIETDFFDYDQASMSLWRKIFAHPNYHLLFNKNINSSSDSLEKI